MRNPISLRLALAMVFCVGFATAVNAQAQRRDTVRRRLTIPDSLMQRLAHGMEARDEQEIVRFREGVKKGEVRQLIATQLAARGSIFPNDSLKVWTQDSDFARGHFVAGVSLEGGDVPSLYLTEGGPNLIWLYFRGGVWTARVNGDPAKTLKVTRYTYAGLGDRDFPVTARWDWEGATPTNPVFGIRCARAWCLLGTTASSAGGPDPDDPDRLGTGGVPSYRRVRGWYDRKVNTNGAGIVWIFPGPETASINTDGEFDGHWSHHADIKVDGVSGEMGVELTKRSGKWKARQKGTKPELTVKHVSYSAGYDMPAAARWSSSHIDLPIPTPISPLGFSTVSFLSASFLSADYGVAWVRCANGCCSSELIF